MSHLDQLAILTPDILQRHILDVGAGKGRFMIECMKRGVDVSGIEYNPHYIQLANKQAEEMGLKLDLIEGRAEAMPYSDESFDFLNFSEVIEHVQDPEQVLCEAHRVLKHHGKAYLSVPNRFAIKDQHYHLYFVNWMPRSWGESLIRLLGKDKNDSGSAGRQKLSEMHYYTYGTIKKSLERAGFSSKDIRLEKLKQKLGQFYLLALIVYIPIRTFGLDSFHILLEKNEINAPE
jgi:ubiquinone/menaquinone biosynthesis C-methylase UbiE